MLRCLEHTSAHIHGLGKFTSHPKQESISSSGLASYTLPSMIIPFMAQGFVGGTWRGLRSVGGRSRGGCRVCG